ncbi:hypothetical protein BDD12DRAFT_560223 [Trichophaea hybrida]|nr:hypothetical protein BDD12DRAFT_560223 [Trichophaea hybrida]
MRAEPMVRLEIIRVKPPQGQKIHRHHYAQPDHREKPAKSHRSESTITCHSKPAPSNCQMPTQPPQKPEPTPPEPVQPHGQEPAPLNRQQPVKLLQSEPIVLSHNQPVPPNRQEPAPPCQDPCSCHSEMFRHVTTVATTSTTSGNVPTSVQIWRKAL